MHIRIDYATSRYSDELTDKPERLAEYLRKAGNSVDVTTDRHKNAGPERLKTDLDCVLLATGTKDAEMLKQILESGEFFRLYVEVGRGDLAIRGVSVLIRLGADL